MGAVVDFTGRLPNGHIPRESPREEFADGTRWRHSARRPSDQQCSPITDPEMAVYTEVSDEALAAFLADYDIGSVVAFRGIAEGGGEQQFLAPHHRRRLHPDAVREAGGPGRAALVPRPDGAPGGARHLLPAAGAGARRRGAAPVGRAARGDHHASCRASGRAGCGRSIARRWGRRWRRCTWPGRDYAPTRRNALGPDGWRPLLERGLRGDADEVQPGLAAELDRALAAILAGWPAGLPVGHIHADLFPDNVFFLDGRLSGLIDFYFAATDLLAYDVAVCLNAWCFEPDFVVQRDQGAGDAAGLRGDPPAVRRRARGAAGAVPGRGDPLPADPAVRLGQHAGRGAW